MNGNLALAAAVLLLNLPFGYLRAGFRKLSVPWFVAVHAAVPLTVALRLLTGVGWRLVTFPLFVAAYALGQLLGGRLRDWWSRRRSSG
jgi:hypothetical protein